MPDRCSEIAELAPELVRGRALDPEQTAHAASCPKCSRLFAGARALGRDLGSVEAPEPSEELVARTLARVRLAAIETPAAVAAPPRRRTTAELLETWALPRPRAGARDRVFVRLAIQAAAAVLVFVCCTVFTLEFYPAYVEALEERNVHACQEHLQVLEAAVARYRRDHPAASKLAEPLQGLALKEALVRGGYAREEDFVCPAVRGARPGDLCYFVRLPDETRRAVAWDRFGNHGGGSLNAIDAGGKARQLDGGRLWQWLGEGRE